MIRMLFVDRNYDVERWQAKFEYIAESLRKKYDVQTYRNLDFGVVDMIRQAIAEKPFDVLVTHVPYGREKSYGGSLDILQDVRKVSNIPIIAYTGAGISLETISSFMGSGIVDEIIEKSPDCERDIRDICNQTEQLIREYRHQLSHSDAPQIITKDGFMTSKVKSKGFTPGRATRIVNHCKEYPKITLLKKTGLDDKEYTCDGRSVFGVFILNPFKGEKVTISIEGEDEKARQLLLRLCGLFDSQYL